MKKLAIKCVWLSPKRNFLKKVAFWAQAKYTSKTRFIYGPLRSINENALLRVFGLLPLVCAFTKMSLIYLTQTQTHQFSHTDPSHLFALHAARPHPHAFQPRLISALCSALYFVISFFLFFFFLSSSSSTRFRSSSFFFFFNFIFV